MNMIRTRPQSPLPWAPVLLAVAVLWIAPVGLGLIGLAVAVPIGRMWSEPALGLWFLATAMIFSPLLSWVGWLIALPPVMLALRQGWFGWGIAPLIGAGAGLCAGALAETGVALPFGIVALLVLRAVVGRVLPL